jgi:hypothetical protein
MANCIFFDIETDGLEDGCQFKCAVAMPLTGGPESAYIFSDVDKFARYLVHEDNADATFVTFNGLSFDFRVVWNLCSDTEVKRHLALVALHRHVDIMYAFLVEFGYPSSMQSFAVRLGESKTWTGGAAAEEDADIEQVKAYCKNDVAVLRKIYAAGCDRGVLERRASSGKVSTWALPSNGFLMVDECMEQWATSPADQSWMTQPLDVVGMASWATARTE